MSKKFTDYQIQKASVYIACQMLINSDWVYMAMGEDFIDSIPDEDYLNVIKIVEQLGVQILKNYGLKYNGDLLESFPKLIEQLESKG